MEPMPDFAQLQLHFVDQIQWRYEVIRPVVLFADRTAAQRAEAVCAVGESELAAAGAAAAA
jgi:hypothetical protein